MIEAVDKEVKSYLHMPTSIAKWTKGVMKSVPKFVFNQMT